MKDNEKDNEDSVEARKRAADEESFVVRSPGANDERFRPVTEERPEPKWRPGVVEVEFKEFELPRRMSDSFLPPSDLTDEEPKWPGAFEKIFEAHGLLSWKRSFPLSYPWSNEEQFSEREASVSADRDRFLTFYFAPEADVVTIAQELAKQPRVAWATPVPKLTPPSALNEPLVGNSDQVNEQHLCNASGCLQNQWYLFRCKVEEAWELAQGNVSGQGVVIADLDWGCNPDHQDLVVDLKFNVMTGRGSASSGTKKDHGTAVLGLAGARRNDRGMAGIAYEATLWAIQAGDEITNDPGHWVAGIDFVRNASDERRKVIILEVQTENSGNIEMVPRINKAIIDALASDVVVCVPAGNGRKDAGIADDGITPIPPTGSILVGATDFNKDSSINKRGVSNFGTRVVIYAPGDVSRDVTCDSLNNNGYRNDFGGTSGAAAKVAGVVALMLQVNSNLTHENIRDILRQSGSPITDDGNKSGVFLNARVSVCEALRRAGGTC